VPDAKLSFSSATETLHITGHEIDSLLQVTKSVKAVIVCDFSSSRARVPKPRLVLFDPSQDKAAASAAGQGGLKQSRDLVRKAVVSDSSVGPGAALSCKLLA
jgi:hypothetical protein